MTQAGMLNRTYRGLRRRGRLLLARVRNVNRPFSDYYAETVNMVAEDDPREAVGGRWDEIGKLQFDFMVSQGLTPEHMMLDFGCGCLRGGLHYIRYLEQGHYYGVDIAEKVLEAGRGYLREAELEHKEPVLRLTRGVGFDWFDEGRTFDYIMAQSVMSHMPLSEIANVFDNVRKVMHENTTFFATFNLDTKMHHDRGRRHFWFPFEALQECGQRYGHEVTLLTEQEYPHYKQRMMRIRRRLEP